MDNNRIKVDDTYYDVSYRTDKVNTYAEAIVKGYKFQGRTDGIDYDGAYGDLDTKISEFFRQLKEIKPNL